MDAPGPCRREPGRGPAGTAGVRDQQLARTPNDTEYGLAGSVWTRDGPQAHTIARRLRTGPIGINIHLAGGVQMPVGGYKQSGRGRESGPEGIEEYLETKSVITLLDR